MCEALTAGYKEKIRKLEAQLNPPSPPVEVGMIESGEVWQLLFNLFPNNDKIFLSDNRYQITSISEIRRFIEWDNTNIFSYEAEIHDCDDFALALAGDFAKHPRWSGFPVGIIWADYGIGAHAFLTCIAWNEDKMPTVYFIEPQNDHEIVMESFGDAILYLLTI